MTIDDATLGRAIVEAFAQPPSEGSTYRVLGDFTVGRRSMLVAASPNARAAVILPGVFGSSPPGFATKRLVAYAAATVSIAMSGAPLRVPATIIECTDAALAEPFTAMARQVGALLEAGEAIAWSDVHGLIRRWSSLFAEGRRLDDHEALGLWGELWVLSRSDALETMLEGWRGPYAGIADFVLEAARLEVKTTTRPFVHHLSRSQAILDNAFFVSLATEEGAGGETLTSLAEKILARLAQPAVFYEGLARIGCSLETLELSKRPRVLVAEPALFRAADVPRVREVDPGITDVRYVVTLEPDRALRGAELDAAARNFSLRMTT